MFNIRWFSNTPTDIEGLKAPVGGLLLAALLALVIGTLLEAVGLSIYMAFKNYDGFDEGLREAMMVLVDWVILLCALPIMLITFLWPWAYLTRDGKFGAARSMIVAVQTLFPVGFFIMLLIGGLSAAGQGAMLALNTALTYGAPLGLQVWLRLAGQKPEIYLPEGVTKPDRWKAWLAVLAGLILWQVSFGFRSAWPE